VELPIYSYSDVALYDMARKFAGQAVNAWDDRLPFHYPIEEALASIALAAFATEAFINGLADMCEMLKADDARFPIIATSIYEVERAHGTTEQKFDAALAALDAVVDRGGEPYQSFAQLLKLRDFIAHPKQRDTIDLKGNTAGPTLIKPFDDRGMTLPPFPSTELRLPWLSRIQTPIMATWACDSAQAMVRLVMETLPTEEAAFAEIRGGWSV
jgi:hypothetical protein